MVFCALCDGAVHCWFIFCACLVMVQCTLLGLACWLPCESHMATAVILAKRNHVSYDFAVGHWSADLLLTDDVVLLPPAIGPTLGTSFVLWALCHPLQRDGFSCTGPTVVYRDKSTGLMLVMEYLFDWTWVWPTKTLRVWL